MIYYIFYAFYILYFLYIYIDIFILYIMYIYIYILYVYIYIYIYIYTYYTHIFKDIHIWAFMGYTRNFSFQKWGILRFSLRYSIYIYMASLGGKKTMEKTRKTSGILNEQRCN